MQPLNRRTLVASSGALASAVLASRPAASQPAVAPTVEKGPLVWLDMDQRELDDAYDQSKYSPNTQQVLGRFASNSEIARQHLGAPKRLAYGAPSIEGLDLYPTRKPNAPIHVFIHGGAWRGGLARDSAFQAEMLVDAGAHFIALDFLNVVETQGDLMPMADQVRRAIAWVYKNARSFNGDPDRLYVSGFSSGSHLGGVALMTDWQTLYGVPADIIKGAVLSSGLYDLKPVRLSARSKYVTFTDANEDALSTHRHLDKVRTPVVLGYGSLETPEFQRQTRDFAAALKGAGKPVKLVVGQGYRHFEMAETYAQPYGVLGREVLAQMGLRVSCG